MNVYSKNESTKAQVSQALFWGVGGISSPFFVKTKIKEKVKFMEIATFNITSDLQWFDDH